MRKFLYKISQVSSRNLENNEEKRIQFKKKGYQKERKKKKSLQLKKKKERDDI